MELPMRSECTLREEAKLLMTYRSVFTRDGMLDDLNKTLPTRIVRVTKRSRLSDDSKSELRHGRALCLQLLPSRDFSSSRRLPQSISPSPARQCLFFSIFIFFTVKRTDGDVVLIYVFDSVHADRKVTVVCFYLKGSS
ncbi:hypothetical protein GOP47_0012260 [Adiantum capillus-veneris]|uniref:Uncharacterized protein n=1 Tax=Adiantum capillus-veneris TaxID=13818 RepID=A0A9D4UQC6_ADICA|nr:hypothetical protein GOP47_0012260 [Adiantum capillus-veneris]